MPRLMKSLLSGFIALAYLAATLNFKTHALQAANPGAYPDLASLLQPRPVLLIYAIAPLLTSAAIYQLYRFTLAGRDPVTGNFTQQGLGALRLSGLFLTAGGMMLMGFETLLCKLAGAPIQPFDPGAGLPFMIIGFGLAAISRNGNLLASNARKMRSELNDIV